MINLIKKEYNHTTIGHLPLPCSVTILEFARFQAVKNKALSKRLYVYYAFCFVAVCESKDSKRRAYRKGKLNVFSFSMIAVRQNAHF